MVRNCSAPVTVRVIAYTASAADGRAATSEVFCLVTDLLDRKSTRHLTWPATASVAGRHTLFPIAP